VLISNIVGRTGAQCQDLIWEIGTSFRGITGMC